MPVHHVNLSCTKGWGSFIFKQINEERAIQHMILPRNATCIATT
jgi:hypothetical protein